MASQKEGKHDEEERPEDVNSSEPEDLALSVSSEDAATEDLYPSTSLSEIQVAPFHALYAADTAGQYVIQLEAIQSATTAIHAQQLHHPNLLQLTLQHNPSRFSDLARAHLSPLDIVTYVDGMPRNTSAGRSSGPPTRLGGGRPLRPAIHPSTAPSQYIHPLERTYVVRNPFPTAYRSMQNGPLLGPPIQHPGLPVRHPGLLIRQPGPHIQHPGLLIRQPGPHIQHPGPLIRHPGLPIRQPGPPIQHPGPLIRHSGWHPNLVPVSSSSSAGTLVYTPTSDGSGGFNGPTPTAFPSPSFNLAAGSGSHISGHFTPSIGVEPVPADLSDATLSSQHSVPGLNNFSASHHPSLNIPHLSQTQGIPPEQLWSRYNPSAPPALGGQHIVKKPLPIPVPPNLPLNRLRSVDLPCFNAALPVPIHSNVYAPPHSRSNPPEVVINPQHFETAPWVPEPDAHILDSADGFRQINTYRNLGMGFSEIAEKMRAVGHPEATHEDVMGIWTRRTADSAQNWGNKKKVIPCEMGDDACDTQKNIEGASMAGTFHKDNPEGKL